jgi:hypothetical protein
MVEDFENHTLPLAKRLQIVAWRSIPMIDGRKTQTKKTLTIYINSEGFCYVLYKRQ